MSKDKKTSFFKLAMSFRDLGATTTRYSHKGQFRSRTMPTVRAMPSDEEDHSPSYRQRPTRLRRPIVLHGRVQRTSVDIDDESSFSQSQNISRHRSYESDQVSVRKEMERRSVYAQLLHETQQYQKTVAELEQVLPEAGEQPEAAWRAKILIKSAQAVDQELWKKLYDYEKMLHSREEDPDVRKQQTACMKLHRDFKRAHKSLVMALTVYEKTQRAEIARLGAVGWSERQDEEEDFYTRAMREREAEIERMNYNMHQVKDMYQDLSFLIKKQQEPIDDLEDYIEEAHAYTRSANRSLWEELMCFADHHDTLCQPQQNITIKDDGQWQVDGEDLIFDVPSCGNMAFDAIHENLTEGISPTRKVSKVTSTESSIVTEYTDESPRGVLDSVSALSDDLRGAEDLGSNGDFLSASLDDFRSADDDMHSRSLRVSEDFHWLMPFETIAADIQAVQSDIAYFGKEVMEQTNLMRDRSSRSHR